MIANMSTLPFGEPIHKAFSLTALAKEGPWQAFGLGYFSPLEAPQVFWMEAAESLYYQFLPWAYSNFGLEVPPPPNISLTRLTQAELIRPVVLTYTDAITQTSSVAGMAILKPESFDLLEIHQIILAPWLQAHPPEKLMEDTLWATGVQILFKGIFKDLQEHVPPYLTVSFPLMGIQETLFDALQQFSDGLEVIKQAPNRQGQHTGVHLPSAFYGDKTPVTISRLDVRQWESNRWGKQGPPCPSGIKVESIQLDKVNPIEMANLLHISFAKQTDSLWEPRYKSLDGCLDLITQELTDLSESLLLKTSKLAYNNAGYLVGFALMKEFSRTLANIPLVCVHPDMQGQGLGRRLVYRQLYRLQELRRLKKTPIHTVSVTHQAGEKGAQRLYMGVGFSPYAQYFHAHWNRSPAIVDLNAH
jgi:GNAT superfamily N-acetyltransferase